MCPSSRHLCKERMYSCTFSIHRSLKKYKDKGGTRLEGITEKRYVSFEEYNSTDIDLRFYPSLFTQAFRQSKLKDDMHV